MQKPRVFIGSSSEGHSIAENVFESLERDTVPVIWTHSFLPGRTAMETLEHELRRHSFAVLIASPDDEVVKRGVTSPSIRDNLLLEFGLFAGALGRRRVFFICPRSPPLELPSDLAGIITATYDADRARGDPPDRAAAVQRACREVRDAILDEWTANLTREEQRSSRIRATAEFQSAQRLYVFTARLRDALLVVQRDAIATFSNRAAFETVKDRARAEIGSVVESIASDASELGVQQEVDKLQAVTSQALMALPFPEELLARHSRHSSDRDRAVRAGKAAFGSFLRGGDPVRPLQDWVGEEARDQAGDQVWDCLAQLNCRYSEWWDRHSPPVQNATAAMQDALMAVTLRIAAAQAEAHEQLLRASEP